ncbi:cytochrome D1 domain-containing protein [Polynucleobacter sp. AM-26B4]|jgi:YVTN family beta-propeller protein|uniref:YVTN family beta-propeller repeat protein n=1 Tax=Polynucleobacter sp. AM-26B4 TaxID=2689103 RepID=UPI001C0B6B82|nr:cytochrome D1 domain-containing protein [Polynucleobacter sp. AM-26B4]MBU3584664.1 YncE family protein [Polynucleobacter sp. AM-26B4]
MPGLTVHAAESVKRTAIVLNSGEASVSLIDMDKRAVYKTFPIGKEPHHLMITPDQKSVLVANAAGDDVVFLDPKTGDIQSRLPNIVDPYHIGYSPNKKWFVAAGNRLDRVDIYAAKNQELKLVKIVKAAKTPSHIAFTNDSKLTFVTLQDSNELIAIDLATQEIVWRMPIGKMPAGVWMTPGDKHLLIGLTGSDLVQVVDWKQQKIIKEIKTGKGAHNFRPLGDKRHIFLTNRVDSTISIIDMDKLEKVADIKGLPSGPDCMDVTADGKELWVTFRFAKKVGIIDIASRKLVTTIPVGKSPHGIFFHSNAAWE